MKGSVSVSGQTASGGDSHGGPAPTTDVAADPNAPTYTPLRRDGPGRPARDDPRHRPRRPGEEDDRGAGFRRRRLDVQRDRPRAGHPGPPRGHHPGPPQEPGDEHAAPQRRLPRLAGRLERRDDLDQPGRGEALRVEGRLCRRVDVPLRDGPGAPPHRQRHVRHGHRRAEGRLQAGRQGVRPRPERVVPRPAGRAGQPDQGVGRGAGARLRRLQRRRQPVQGQPPTR